MICQKCPVCEGRGVVPAGFYVSNSAYFVSGTAAEVCKVCNGAGVCYPPDDYGPWIGTPDPPTEAKVFAIIKRHDDSSDNIESFKGQLLFRNEKIILLDQEPFDANFKPRVFYPEDCHVEIIETPDMFRGCATRNIQPGETIKIDIEEHRHLDKKAMEQ